MAGIMQFWKADRDAIFIGGLSGYIAFLVTTAQGFNFQVFSSAPIDNFITNAQALSSFNALKPGIIFILLGIILAVLIKYLFFKGRLR